MTTEREPLLDDLINMGGRIVSHEGVKRLFLRLHELPEPQQLRILERLAQAFRASPHNRHACAGPAGKANDLLQHLPSYRGAARDGIPGVPGAPLAGTPRARDHANANERERGDGMCGARAA